MRDDGTLVERGSDFERGPFAGTELVEEDGNIDGISDVELASGEKTTGTGHIQHVALVLGQRGNSPLAGDLCKLELFALSSAGSPVVLFGHGGFCRGALSSGWSKCAKDELGVWVRKRDKIKVWCRSYHPMICPRRSPICML